MVTRKVRAALIKADRAIKVIIEDDYFVTSEPEAVAALLGATRRLITAVEA